MPVQVETVSEPESEPNQETIKLWKQLEEKDKQLEGKNKQIALQESQNVQDIPQLVDNKIGPGGKISNLSKISEYDRRGYQILASRFGEIIRRKL